jgi:hypothetical protein
MLTKICTGCDKTLEATAENFYRQKNGKFGFTSKCKTCVGAKDKKIRDDQRKRGEALASARWRERHPDRHALATLRMHAKKKGLDVAEVEAYWRSHDGLCDICGKPERGLKKRLSIEHDHVTGKFRGLTCGRCNTLIGMADDDISVLEAAIEYLKVGGRHDYGE